MTDNQMKYLVGWILAIAGVIIMPFNLIGGITLTTASFFIGRKPKIKKVDQVKKKTFTKGERLEEVSI